MLKLISKCGLLMTIGVLPLFAQDGTSINLVDTLWVLISAILVFFMNAGFAFVEADSAESRTPRISWARISACSQSRQSPSGLWATA